MVDYRNILRLQSQGHSQREIERELYCSRHTISEVLIRAKAAGIAWPLEDDVTNEDIQAILFPGKYAYSSPYTVPDYAYIHRELAKNGVTLTLRQGSQRGRRSVFVYPVLREVPPLGAGGEGHHAHHAQARGRHAGGLGRRSAWKCQVLCSLKTHKNQFGIGTEQLDRYLSSFCAVREGRKFSRRGLCRAGSVVA